MKEFKGTKSELELKFVSGVCIGIGTIGAFTMMTANTILPDTDEEYAEQKEEIESNMKLYASAPKLLDALILARAVILSKRDMDGLSPKGSEILNKINSAINKAIS